MRLKQRSLEDFKNCSLMDIIRFTPPKTKEAIEVALAYPSINLVEDEMIGDGKGMSLVKYEGILLILIYDLKRYNQGKLLKIMEIEPFFDDDIEAEWGCLFSFWTVFGVLYEKIEKGDEVDPRDSKWYKPILISKYECSEEEWRVLTRNTDYEKDWIEIPSFTKRYQLADEIENRKKNTYNTVN